MFFVLLLSRPAFIIIILQSRKRVLSGLILKLDFYMSKTLHFLKEKTKFYFFCPMKLLSIIRFLMCVIIPVIYFYGRILIFFIKKIANDDKIDEGRNKI